MTPERKAVVAEQYRAVQGKDPYRIVPARCWEQDCETLTDTPYIDAVIGRHYCEVHTLFQAGRRAIAAMARPPSEDA